MAKTDANPSASHHSKKKRTEENSSTTETSQKPIQLQRRRVWRACESCRRKKIKCDGCEPTCSQCSASGSACTWLQTKDRAALSRHYVQELEARLLHMESLFKQVAPALGQIGTANGGSASSSSDSPMASESSPSAAAATAILRSIAPERPSEPNTPIKIEDDVSDSFGQLALDEYGHMRWMGGSSSMSLIQSFRALTTAPQHRISPAEEDPNAPGPSINKFYFPASVFFGQVHALPGPEEVEYPERDLADKLVDTYFSRLHYLMPVIDKPSFIAQYTNIMNNTHDTSLARSQTAFISLVFAVFACAANIAEDPRLKDGRVDEGGMGMLYYERALILQYISHAKIQPAHVQCFLLLSSFLCSINCLPQAWILVGQALRTAQDLGLHRSPRRLQYLTPIERETRRKIWWGVYVLDRMLAVALGRPLGINDADCDVEYPVEVDDDHLPQYFQDPNTPKMPSLMAGTVALTKLYEIAGRMLRQVYALDNCRENLEPERKLELERVVEGFHTEVTQWCDNLPPQLKNQSSTPEQAAMGAVLCSHFYGVLTTLHRNLLPVKREDPMTPKSTSHAVSSARSCITLAPSIKTHVPSSHHLAFFIQHLFGSAAVVLLYAMHSSDAKASAQALDEARNARSAIEYWEGQWPGARKCKELLTELIDTAADAVAKHSRDVTMQPPAVRHERRRSVTIATVPPNTLPGRMMKSASKQTSRRNRSREQSGANRRLAASPYHVDTALRARSTSRKRGHDEAEGNESYYQSFASPTLAASNTSSPSSMNLPSPATSTSGLVQETSPTLASASAYYAPNSAGARGPSSPLYEYSEYNLNGGALNQSSQWNGNGIDIYSPDGGQNMMYDYGAYPPAIDSYANYDAGGSGSGSSGLSSTPSTSTFAAPGLPFRGLEFIRNYNNNNGGGYSGMEQDSLWQSYEPVDFDYNPDLPFTLGEPEP